MKAFYILLLIFFSGCATNDIQTINLLNQRISGLEKLLQTSPKALNGSINEVIEQPPYNAYPDRLNDAQRDFVNFMLNYLADED